jgi:hypothetical protein
MELELQKRRDEIVFNKLKKEFSFFYDHLVALSREQLEEEQKDWCQDEINDLVNDSLHTECMDEYHSSTSASVEFNEVSDIMELYQKRMEIIKEMYGR